MVMLLKRVPPDERPPSPSCPKGETCQSGRLQAGQPAPQLIHSRPVHVHNVPSPFSKDSPEQNYRGFLNLTILLLFVSMARLVLENFRKYGVLLSLPGRHVNMTDVLYGALALSSLLLNILIAYGVERYAVGKARFGTTRMYFTLIVGNVSLLLLLPSRIVWTHMYHPLLGFFALFLALVLAMKMISYHLVNAELRRISLDRAIATLADAGSGGGGRGGRGRSRPTSDGQDDQGKLGMADGRRPYPECPYPRNVTLGNLLYFWVAPTLCYQPSYPRTPTIRLKFLVKRLIEFSACLAVMHVLTEQYALPTVQNSLKPISELDWTGMLERLLKLSISSLYIWLIGFYALFHSFLNAFAEVIRFGDRSFYRAWWNASTVDEYWRLWNAPVHQWFKRHLYCPLLYRGYSPQQAQLLIFTLSAVAHEFLVAVPTNIVQGWAFLGMLLQVPLISLTTSYMRRRPQSSVGNFVFWITFCILGQPMCVLLYYRAWVMKTANSGTSAILFFFQI